MPNKYNEKSKLYHRNKYYGDPEYKQKHLEQSRKYWRENKEVIALRRKLTKNEKRRTYITGHYEFKFFELPEYQQFVFDLIISGLTDTIIYKCVKSEVKSKYLSYYLPSYNRSNNKINAKTKKEYSDLKKQFTDTNVLVVIRIPPDLTMVGNDTHNTC